MSERVGCSRQRITKTNDSVEAAALGLEKGKGEVDGDALRTHEEVTYQTVGPSGGQSVRTGNQPSFCHHLPGVLDAINVRIRIPYHFDEVPATALVVPIRGPVLSTQYRQLPPCPDQIHDRPVGWRTSRTTVCWWHLTVVSLISDVFISVNIDNSHHMSFPAIASTSSLVVALKTTCKSA